MRTESDSGSRPSLVNSRKKRDPEVLALRSILKYLVQFDWPTQIRMLDYLFERTKKKQPLQDAEPGAAVNKQE
jgi:hypothetical protein